jgi:ribose 5-phosphate isomerase B
VKIAFGTDDRTDMTSRLVSQLKASGHNVTIVADGEQWADVGRAVGQAVAAGDADYGVVCCWTGTGVSIAANKVHGARAALCVDAETARGARKWNDANVLALSLRLASSTLADEIVAAFLTTAPDPSEADQIRHLER